MGKFAISAICCCLVIALCVSVLAGWQFDLIVLRRILPNALPTTLLTALVMLALATALTTSLMVLRGKLSPKWVWVCWGLAGASILVALMEGMQYLVNLVPGLEVAFYPEGVLQQGGVFPGRPSPQAIVSALLVGLSIGLSLESGRRTQRVVMLLGLMGMILPWLALFGYASTTSQLYALLEAPQTGISPLAAIGFLALGIGVIGLRPDEGLIGLLTVPSPGGQLVRWLLPIALVVPLVAGWVVTYWSTSGLFGMSIGIALSWGVTSLLFAGLVIWQGVTIHQYDSHLKLQANVLERSNQELQEFAYVSSHDLQEPLRNISGFVQLLQQTYQGQLDDEANDWINRTVASAHQMQMMIRDILAYSRVDSRIGPLEPTLLADVFNEVLEVLADSIRDSSAKVTCSELPTVMGDRLQLVQLMQNLIGNALKYHSDQSPRVHVSAERKGKEWVVAVQDNGIGIEPQHQERIFGIFRRLHTQDEYPGTGIGLAVCRRVVERHGGKTWVTSAPGQGSTFYFTIPDEEVVQT
jgi:signal transduction histidine kinase